MPCPNGKFGPGTCYTRGCWPWPAFSPPPCEEWPAGSVECCSRAGVGNEGDITAQMQCENEGGTWEDTGQIACGGVESECVDPKGKKYCWGGTSFGDWILVLPLFDVQIQADADCIQLDCWKIKCKIFRCKPKSNCTTARIFKLKIEN